MRLRRRLAVFAEVRRGEGAKTLLMSLYFFLLMASYYVIKPVRNSLFLEQLGPKQLPYAYLATALVIGLVASLYTRLVARFERHLLIMASTAFFILDLLLFWWFFRFDIDWMAGLFYLWAAVFSVGAVTQFWSMSNEIFNPEEAKRLFGLVGGGGVLGGIVGGLLSNLLVKPLGTQNLLLVSAAVLLPCLAVILAVHRMEWRLEREAAPARRAEAPLVHYGAGFKAVRGSPYLSLLALMMVVMVVVATLVDYAFNSEVGRAIPGQDAKTAYFGVFFAALSALSLLVQFLLTSPVLRYFGVGAALLLLPVSLMGASLSAFLVPALWSVSALKLADGSLRYSLNQSTREILFLPVPLADKYSAKAAIDMSLQRWARGGAALIILAAIALHLSWPALALMTALFCAAWVAVVRRTSRQYVGSLGRLLEERPAGPTEARLPPPEAGEWPALTARGAAALAAAAAETGLLRSLLAAPRAGVRRSALVRLAASGERLGLAELAPLAEPATALPMEPWIDPLLGQPPAPFAPACPTEEQGEKILELCQGPPEARAQAAALIAAGPAPDGPLLAALAGLITDPSAEVRGAGALAAAHLKDERLIGALLAALGLPCPGQALLALSAHGPAPLAAHLGPALLTGDSLSPRAAALACAALAQASSAPGGQEATAVLGAALSRPSLRLAALRALADASPPPALPAERTELGFRQAAGRSAWALVVLGDYLEAFPPEAGAPPALIERALEGLRRESFEEALLWEELRRPGRGLPALRRALDHPAKEMQAAAQELLEQGLPREARGWARLMMMGRPAPELAEVAASQAGLRRRPGFTGWLPELLRDASPDLRVAAIQAVARLAPRHAAELAPLERSDDPLERGLARAAAAAARRASPPAPWT